MSGHFWLPVILSQVDGTPHAHVTSRECSKDDAPQQKQIFNLSKASRVRINEE
jgi:hypothetical protein